MSADMVWVSASSHRSRAKLRWAVPELGPEHGIWPNSGGWPTGSYYQVAASHADALRSVKGLRVLTGEPRGGRLFKRFTL
jgi:hypothetical protein